ncbi:MAG: S8 family serine peptidase, partial [Bacteroidetes bacterium]|nr:S8 family serine peptidase [Bacteroidota bacterium]
SFSSKGPTVESYGIKPDIVAPGVGVLSCKLGGGYMAMSGTSMAAPFVTGLAASLRKLHPEWSAYEIRNAIIESAENLPQSVFVSGSGMVNPLQSIHLTSSVSPSNISFGFASTQNESWNQSRTLSIKNETNEELSYVISPQTIAGISVRITPQSFQLKPKEEKIISLELNASMTMLPNNKSLQDGYVGKIAVTTQYDTITIPFGFFKGNVLQVNFDETPWQTVILNNKGLVKSLNPQKNNVTLIVSEGTYDILTNFYSSHYVVKENIPVAGSTIVDVAKSDASHKVTLQLVDENNEPFNSESANYSLSTLEGMFNTTIGASVISMSGSRLNTTGSASFEKYISSFSSKYIFGYAANCMEGNTTTYSFEAALEHGIKSDTVINFAAEQNKKLEVRYDLDSNNVKRVFPITWTGIKDNSRLVSVSFYDEAAAGLYYPFQQTTYFRGVSSSKFPLFHYREAYTF